MPDWANLLIAVVSGGFAKQLLDWFVNRESRLWERMGALEQRVYQLEKDLQAERVLVVVLKGEINELLENAGKPPKYDLNARVP
jgi:hypothetical protein